MTLLELVGIGALLHVLLSAWRFRHRIGPAPASTTQPAWPRSAWLLVVVVTANIVAAGHPLVLALDLAVGVAGIRAGHDYATRWQPTILALLLAGLDVVGRESDPFIQSLATHLPADAPTLPLSVDGIEAVLATNHVGHALLYSLIEGRVRAAPVARVVLTSSASRNVSRSSSSEGHV
jgi:NAD(P)-dependent dehydrogenase (short-subunit alcohol dehydrogenase family)